jgi:hypothetical protein
VAGLGKKTFTAGEVLTASDVNGYLMDQSVMVFGGTAARSSAIPTPTEGMLTYLADTNAVEVYNGAAYAAVGGKILQVLSTFKNDTFTTTSNTFVDVTGLSVSITPTSATSKIFVIAQTTVQGAPGADNGMGRLMRDSTAISVGAAAGSRTPASFGIAENVIGNTTIVPFLDSPATTSATTYKIQIRANTSGQQMNVNRNATDADVSTQCRCTSSITVMEVSA